MIRRSTRPARPAAIAGVGTLEINSNGGYTFTPAANFNGVVPVATYTLTDGSSARHLDAVDHGHAG